MRKFIAIILAAFLCTSCGALMGGMLGGAQGYEAAKSGRTYLGVARSSSDAKSMARSAGFTYYRWYSDTGNVYGWD